MTYPDHINFPGYTYFPERNDYTEFELFCAFLFTARLETHTHNARDFSSPIHNKCMAVIICYNEVLNQIQKFNEETEETKKIGFSSGIQNMLLLTRYETYLNSIYSLCETLSFLVSCFYPNGTLSNKFDKQKKQFLTDKEKLDILYSKILKKTDWYDEVHAIRSETTHFLSGFIFISNLNEPGFLAKETYNQRKGAPKEINIESIESHVKSIQTGVYSFLNDYSHHFMKLKLNKHEPLGQICLRTDEGRTGFRSLTLSDCLNKRPKKCIAIEFDCPHRQKCKCEPILRNQSIQSDSSGH